MTSTAAAPATASGRWNGEWPTFVIQSLTTYTLVAPSLEAALAWFTDAADINLVDCAMLTFGSPDLIEILNGQAMP